MPMTIETKVLSYEGAEKMIAAAIAKATEMRVPQCISIVDSGGHLLAFARELDHALVPAGLQGRHGAAAIRA